VVVTFLGLDHPLAARAAEAAAAAAAAAGGPAEALAGGEGSEDINGSKGRESSDGSESSIKGDVWGEEASIDGSFGRGLRGAGPPTTPATREGAALLSVVLAERSAFTALKASSCASSELFLFSSCVFLLLFKCECGHLS
jgi:hypothetical protein